MKSKSEQEKAIINIRITSNLIGQVQHSFMADFGLSMAQFNVLRILRGANSALSVQVIKERMIEKSPNTTRLMDKLIEKELIERTRSEKDKRIVFVELTSLGLNLLKQIDIKSSYNNFFSVKLSDEESAQLNFLLNKVRKEWM